MGRVPILRGCEQEPGVVEDPFPNLSAGRGRHLETLGPSSFGVLGVPVNLTVLLEESLHHPYLEVGPVPGLPNHVFVDVTSYRSLCLGGSERNEEIL